MELVEDHQSGAVQGGIRLDQAGQDALGEDLDPGGRAHRRFVPDPVADQLPDLLSGQVAIRRAAVRAARRRGSSITIRRPSSHGSDSRLQRHDGGLAGSGGGLEHGSTALQERYPEGGKQIVYREGGQEGHRTTISPLWNRIRADPVVMGGWHGVCMSREARPRSWAGERGG